MKKIIEKITPKFIFQNIEEIVASLLFVVTLVLVIINVLMRYVFRTGIPWAEEMATSCFVWTAFIGSAACYKMRAHVGVDILVNKLPQKAQNVVKIAVDILMAFLCGYLFYLSCVYVLRSYRKPTAILGVSSAWISSSLTLAFLDMAIWSLIFIVQDWKSIKKYGRVIGPEEEV